MRETEFRAWLKANGSGPSSISTRLSDARRVEGRFGDLDQAYADDRLDAIVAALTYIAADRAAGRKNESGLAIAGDVYNGLASYKSAVTLYRRFAEAGGSEGDRQADRIRQFVIDTAIRPARERGEASVVVTTGDVHRAMGLDNAMPAICSALGGAIFERQAEVSIADRQGPPNGATVRFTYALTLNEGNWAEEELRRRYGPPSTDTARMLGFHLNGGSPAIAMERGVAGVKLWVEDDASAGPSPIPLVRRYVAAEPRHSNLPARLKHAPPGHQPPRPVATAQPETLAQLRALLDWYEQRQRTPLDVLRARFLAAFPDFEAAGAFAATAGAYHDSYRVRVDALLAAAAAHPAEGWAVLRDVLAASQGGRGALPPFFASNVVSRLPRARDLDPVALDEVLDRLVREHGDPAAAAAAFNAVFWPQLSRLADDNLFRDTRVVPSTILAAVAPDRAIGVRYTLYSNAERLLNGRTLFANAVMTADEYRAVLALAEQIRAAMTGWGWAPRDLWDVHGFVLATCKKENDMPDLSREAIEAAMNECQRLGEAAFVAKQGLSMQNVRYRVRRGADTFPSKAIANAAYNAMGHTGDGYGGTGARLALMKAGYEIVDTQAVDVAPQPTRAIMPDPTNLILHGPPGTGKTFATAREAVRLCGEVPPVDRAALMTRYRTLAEAGRIEFVTFHQSMAYEEFVEGLRPVQGGEGQAGFELQPTPGLFRRIARRAETSTGPGEAIFTIGERKVFKMSIGEAASADNAHLFDEAIAGGYALLGFGDLDWSEARFADRQAIIDAIHAEEGSDEASALSGRVQMPHIFRNWMRVGDLIVVSKGNGLFRAIGEITGDYQHVPRDGGGYAHRRAVRWLWIDRAGVPVSEIYAQRFSMRSAYVLTPEDINVPALERYIASQQDAGTGAPEPFVLVIDEINRANISKVFGELITLLEADKRLGAANELKVRLPYSGELFGVPANLNIVATMNTADRSIALIDKALRRRFTFREMMPDYTVAGMADTVAGAGVSLAALLAAINDRIEYLLDREHQIGHAWLLGCTDKPRLDAAMRDKVIPLIAEYFFEDWGRTADVLGGRDDNPFLQKIVLPPPPGLAGEEPRYRWRLRDAFAADAYSRCIAGR